MTDKLRRQGELIATIKRKCTEYLTSMDGPYDPETTIREIDAEIDWHMDNEAGGTKPIKEKA